MALDEKSLYPLFSRWISSRWAGNGAAAFELKIVPEGRAYRFAQLPPHQERALVMSSSPTGVYHKISDQSMGQKPFDSFVLANAKAYVVVCFDKSCHMVRIGDYQDLRDRCLKASVPESELALVAEHSMEL